MIIIIACLLQQMFSTSCLSKEQARNKAKMIELGDESIGRIQIRYNLKPTLQADNLPLDMFL
jgi:hypothetical protein